MAGFYTYVERQGTKSTARPPWRRVRPMSAFLGRSASARRCCERENQTDTASVTLPSFALDTRIRRMPASVHGLHLAWRRYL